jgi:hypothetical protein
MEFVEKGTEKLIKCYGTCTYAGVLIAQIQVGQ